MRDMAMNLRSWSTLSALFALVCFARPSSAQYASVEQTSVGAESQRIVVSADWPSSMTEVRDSLNLTRVDHTLASTFAGLDGEVSVTVELNSPNAQVQIRAAEFDELKIEAGELPNGLVLSGEPNELAKLVNVGRYRKKLVGNVVVRMVGYDRSSGVLRRYRRVTVDITPSAPEMSKVNANPHLQVTTSALATGTIHKVPVTRDGVYVITRQTLSQLGHNPDVIDPNAVRVFGNGGRPLPAVNADPRPADLIEKNVRVEGGGDGSFGTSDAVYFYANDVAGWDFDKESGEWIHYTHPYANENFVFISVGSVASSNIALEEFPDLQDAQVKTATDGLFVRDVETFMWSKEHGSGHTWVSNPIRQGSSIEVTRYGDLEGLLPDSVFYTARVAIASNPRSSVEFHGGNTLLASVRATFAILPGAERATASAVTARFDQPTPGATDDQIAMQLPAAINEPQAALDWFRIRYRRDLRARGGVLSFYSDTTAANLEYRLSGFSEAPIVWDVTSSGQESALDTRVDGADYRIQFSQTGPRRIIAFERTTAQVLETEFAVAVPNQNLHEFPTFPEFLIIAPAEFMGPATELANMRRAEGMNVAVVDVEQITNEFSGGVPDMRAVRDFLKFIYDRAPDDDNLLDMVLLFGDGHFDFRKIGEGSQDVVNWIFPYETQESFVPDRTFTSDDYFGLLDDEEGEWLYRGFSSPTTERLDIGIGRIPARDLAEAELMLEKIKRYESPETRGPWRTRYTLVADDAFTGSTGGTDEGDLHLANMDAVAELVQRQLYPEMNLNKIYGEAYERVFQNAFRLPGAKADILQALEEGVLLFNYSGHGGPIGLAQEDMFTKADAEGLTNADKLAIFVTATCSFGWWDIDDTHSAAETLLSNPNGGAVAMLTTSRTVYTSADPNALNPGLNRELNRAIFAKPDGKPRRLGDAFRETKNTTVGLIGNSRKFSLLGDPSMRIGLPDRDVIVQSINDQDLSTEVGQVKALDRVTLRGIVTNAEGEKDQTYSGIINITVFDSERSVPVIYRRWMPTPDYKVREDLIWRGDVEVSQGEFIATFVVPKDIAYSNNAGRVSVYANGPGGHAIGYNENFLVGGTSSDPPNDVVGPELELFLNDTTFVSGGLTTKSPKLIVRLFDESGINTVGAGVGHELLLVLNDDESNAIDISDGFRSEPGSYQRGSVEWPLEELDEGEGSLTVRAWDVVNNSGQAELSYVVTDSENLSIRSVFNYPNPTSGRTRFVFEHNQLPGTQADIQVRIYSLSGKPVKTIDSDESLPSGVLSGGLTMIPWDGLDEDGDRLATGIYLYKLRIRVETPDGGRQVAEKIEKLAIIR